MTLQEKLFFLVIFMPFLSIPLCMILRLG